MKFVLASQNVHKQRELQAVLAPYGVELLLQRDLGVPIDVDETGATFAENARLKADAALRATGLAAIADDSGLMVDALNGEPGIYSARFGGARNKTDRDRLQYLLERMQGVPQERRSAKFVSVITLLTPDGRQVTARGECPGRILTEPHGENGFGYDPVFYVPEQGCTFAELPAAEKNRISHRARALAAFAEKVKKENLYVNE